MTVFKIIVGGRNYFLNQFQQKIYSRSSYPIEDVWQLNKKSYIEKSWYDSIIKKQVKIYNNNQVIFVCFGYAVSTAECGLQRILKVNFTYPKRHYLKHNVLTHLKKVYNINYVRLK